MAWVVCLKAVEVSPGCLEPHGSYTSTIYNRKESIAFTVHYAVQQIP